MTEIDVLRATERAPSPRPTGAHGDGLDVTPDTAERHMGRLLEKLPAGASSPDGRNDRTPPDGRSDRAPPVADEPRASTDSSAIALGRLLEGARNLLPDAVTRAPQRGQTMGRYLVLGELGRGGMGTVLKAHDESLDRAIAIKLLHSEAAEHHALRLRREAQALAKLSHPNIVHVYEVGETEGQWFIAMELVPGRTLWEWQQAPRTWQECVKVYLQVGEGLAAAHAMGLVHRDFKPDNCIIEDNGRPKVLDFGLVGGTMAPSVETREKDTELESLRKASASSSLTSTGTVMGTPAYMPPEQIDGLEADARSDQFSFCVSLYEALYGERPFEGSTLVALMVAMRGSVMRPAPKGSKVPLALRTVLLRGLATDPAKRWPSMDALLVELRRLVAPRARRWVGGVGLAIAAVAAFVAWQQRGELDEKDAQLRTKDGVIIEKDEVISDKEAKLQQQLTRVEEQLAAQKGLRAKDVAKDAGRELEAVRLAVEAFEELGADAEVSREVFEGLTHALAAIDRGIALRGHEGKVLAVAVSPDGGRIATASGDQTTRLWDASSGAPLRTFEGHTGKVHAVAFSLDGARLATASVDKTARIWETATGKQIGSLEHQDPVRGVAFSPDGQHIATASGDVAWVWHLDSGDGMPLVGHTDAVWSVAFSPDGTRLWTAGEDQTARLWDADSGALLQTLEGHTGPVYDVEVSRDGSQLVTASQDETARLWDTATGEEITAFEHGKVVYAVALSPDGTRLATGTFDDGVAHLWDVATGRGLGSFHHEDAVVDVAFSPGGHKLVTASWDFTARSWDLDPGGALTALQHPSRVDAVAFSSDGSRVATGSRDGTARVWDAHSGTHLATMQGHALDVLAVTFSPVGKRIATASWDGTARVWDATTATLLQTFEGHTGPVRAVAFSPDGWRIATASRDGTARVWDVATGEELRSLSHEGPVIDVMFAPEGERLLTVGADDTARVWDAATGRPLSAFGYDGAVTAVAFSTDGKTIAAATKDYSIRSWNADTGEDLEMFGGHTAPVNAVVFSGDGTRLATGSEDGTARVWDAATGEQLTAFPHECPVSSVAFSADGTALVTGSGNEVARVWTLDTHAWRTWGCLVLDGRQADTGLACPADTKTVELDPSSTLAEPVTSPADAAESEPEMITVHGVELVLIPGGTFTMGSPEGEGPGDERPQHEVELDSFYLARTEVTNAQYAVYQEANPDVPKPGGWEDERYNHPKQPVIGVSWHEAKAYCDWAGFKLPTEAQWEYAARAGTTTAYSFGDDEEDLERFGWYDANTIVRERGVQHARTQSVGTKGANAYGLYDVYGNVWEWTLDNYGSYATSPRTGDGLRHEPVGDANRVIRGSSWGFPADVARSATRNSFRPGYRIHFIGIRPAQGIH